MEAESTLYSYAIIAQPFTEKHKYLWQRVGKYKRLSDAEKALNDFIKEKVSTKFFKIIPYFKGYWWTDHETEKKEYFETNKLLWEYLEYKDLADEARSFISNKKEKEKKRWIFF